MTTQQEINEYYQTIADEHNEEIIKNEKAYYKEIEKEYKEAQGGAKALLVPLFATLASKEGLIYQKDLNGYKRLKTLEKQIANNLNNVLAAEKKLLKPALTDHITNEYYFSLYLIAQKADYIRIKKITDKEIDDILKENWAGELYTASLLNKKAETVSSISKDLMRNSVDGLTLQEANNIIDKRFTSALKHSLLVYQNELSRKKTTAGNLATEKSGISEDVYMWLCGLDDKSCQYCSPLDGKKMKKSEWRVSPPLHPRCRCTMILIVPDWEQKTRAARDLKTYKTYKTLAKDYGEWKKEQGL